MPAGNDTPEMTELSGSPPGVPTDHDLLQRAVAGDQRAFNELIHRHGRYLLGVAYAMTQSRSDAEDVVQETLIAALQSSFRGESKVRTWLVGILAKRVSMLRRTRRRKPLTFVPEYREPAGGSTASGSDARIDLAAMLSQLSEDHRQVLVLRELEGMSYEQMAEALGVPRGTIESRLYRAREELRKRFAGYVQ